MNLALDMLLAVIATAALAVAVGLTEARATDQAHEAARQDFKRDLAAAQICKGKTAIWDGRVLTCMKEIAP